MQSYNVHTIALQVPIRQLTRNRTRPRDVLNAARCPRSACGRRPAVVRRGSPPPAQGKYVAHGPWEQVSRLGNPLFNEVLVPMAEKDRWNAREPPRATRRYARFVNRPELQGLLPALYPGVFPHLAAYDQAAWLTSTRSC